MRQRWRQQIINGLLLAMLLSSAACKETILHGLDEVRANQIKVTLEKAGIHALKVFEGNNWNIQVDREKETSALAVLEKSRILKRESRTAVEPPKGLIPSREERMFFSERQLATNLENTLEHLPYVLEARVHLYLSSQETLSFNPRKEDYTASVLVVTDENKPANAAIEKAQIQQLIAGASGVNPNSVSVVIANANADSYEKKLSTPADVQTATKGEVEAEKPEVKSAPATEHQSSRKIEITVSAFGVCCLMLLLFIALRKSRKKKKGIDFSRKLKKEAAILSPDQETSLAEQANGTIHSAYRKLNGESRPEMEVY